MNPAEDGPLRSSMAEAERLLEKWDRLGLAHMTIGGACSCGVGGVLVALDDFEQDIADYLQAEAERLDRGDVLQYMKEHGRAGDLWSISKLLTGLAQPTEGVAMDTGTSTFLLERLARTLQSFEKLHGS
jgi:hypothetical protein